MRYINLLCSICLFTVLAIIGCTDMNDSHQEYLDRGEVIYAARPDSVKTRGGNKRAMIDIYYTAQRIEKCLITWNNAKDSVEFDLPEGKSLYSYELKNLPEDDYVFIIRTSDKYANTTIPTEFTGKVYGERYQLGLLNVDIIGGTYEGADLLLEWKEASLRDKIEVRYIDNDDAEHTVWVDADKTTIVLPNIKQGSTIAYRTYFIPTETAVDAFPALYWKEIQTQIED